MPRHTPYAASIALGLAVALAWTARAHAEEPVVVDVAGYCPDPLFAPRAGLTVPANTPAFPFRPDTRSSAFVLRTSTFDLVSTSEIADPNPKPGPWTDGRLLVPIHFAPTDALAEGSYAIHYHSSCAVTPTTTPDRSQLQPFLVGPSSPLPTKVGVLRLVEPTRTIKPEYCVDVRAVARVEAVFDAQLVPFLATTQVRVLGEKVLVGDAFYGALLGSTASFEVEANCRDTLHLGPRPITLEAHLAGLGELTPATLDVDLACDADAYDTCKPLPLPDAGTAPDGGVRADDEGDPGGCSLAGARETEATLPTWCWLALAIAGGRRTRMVESGRGDGRIRPARR